MDESVKEKIKNIFRTNNGFAHSNDVVQHGINKRYLALLLEEGSIYKVKRGLYKWNDADFETSDEIVEVSKIVPNGVVCLLSALSYYKLTTFTSHVHQIAVQRKSKVVLPYYPPIKLFYFTDKYFTEGVECINIDGNKISIYCMEKTICDCFRFKNDIGKDILLECIREYMPRKERNIDKLMKFSRLCHVEEVIQQYVEVLV